jgi:hypothetical protein
MFHDGVSVHVPMLQYKHTNNKYKHLQKITSAITSKLSFNLNSECKTKK